MPFCSQTVIPPPLLEHYISMTEPVKAQTIDTELARHCAFTFPGAVLALGKENWHCLKDTYELLASDMQVTYFIWTTAFITVYCTVVCGRRRQRQMMTRRVYMNDIKEWTGMDMASTTSAVSLTYFYVLPQALSIASPSIEHSFSVH